MLLAQAATPDLFRQKCSGCHKGTPAEFARKSMIEKEGVVVGRSSQKDLREFLTRHGGLRADEILIVVDSLKRVLQETQQGSPK